MLIVQNRDDLNAHIPLPRFGEDDCDAAIVMVRHIYVEVCAGLKR
jgi:hypothetical protein